MISTIAMMVLAAMIQGTSPNEIRSLARGDQSNIDDARQVVARTSAEFDTLWRQHAPERPAPTVDFSREMVVGVFLGSRPTAGYGVDILGTREDQGTLVVQYRERRPARGMITAQVLTSAFQIVALPARTGEVKFERVP